MASLRIIKNYILQNKKIASQRTDFNSKIDIFSWFLTQVVIKSLIHVLDLNESVYLGNALKYISTTFNVLWHHNHTKYEYFVFKMKG